MDGYIIQRIALYVKDAKIVKLLFYIAKYRDLINISDYHYDELVLIYSKKIWQDPLRKGNLWQEPFITDLRIIKSLYRLNIPYRFLHYGHQMDHLTSTGNLEIVKWLHENRKANCSVYAMNNAAQNGHLEIVKWLHENRKEGCTKYAMDYAANLEIVKWLHYNRKEGCTAYAMDYAAQKGNIEIVKWLHYNRKEGCTRWAINWAASNGHIEVVKWLKENIKN